MSGNDVNHNSTVIEQSLPPVPPPPDTVSPSIVPEAPAKFNRLAIAEHCKILHGAALRAKVPGKLVLAVFGEDPDTREKFAEVRHFQIGDVDGMVSAAMEFDGIPHRNIYAPLAIMRPELAPKAKGGEADVVSVLGLVIDGDADKGKERPTSPLPVDYIVESSAGNFQELLFLNPPLPRSEAKPLARALQRATKAEFADDLSHVWRVPGTLNWPNAAKVHDPKRNRSRTPQPVRVHKAFTEWTTTVERLRQVLAQHMEKPRSDRTPQAARTKLDICPVKVRAFHEGLRDAGYYDRDPEDLEVTRLRWIHAAKALSYDLGDVEGRKIWEEVVCWQGKRKDEGLAVDATEADHKWAECSALEAGDNGIRPLTHGTLVDEARELYQWSGSQLYLERDKTTADMFKGVGAQVGQGMAPKPLRVIRASSFAGKDPPKRDELVSGFIPAKIICAMYADGAAGKSLLALMLAVSIVTGRLWLNRIVQHGPVVYVCCEDDEEEVHRRLADICRAMGVELAMLDDLHIIPLVDEESVLAMADGRSSLLTTTPLYTQLAELTGDVKPRLLIGDTLSDIFAGSENDRMQAKQFVKIMNKLVLPHRGTGMILAHPSLEGMRSGSGSGGTTGWNNSFRQRSYLERLLDENGKEADESRRVLRTKKANYGSNRNEIELRYENGFFHVAGSGDGVAMADPLWKEKRAERCFLDLLRWNNEHNNFVSVAKRGGLYAPEIFRADASKQGVTKPELEQAMKRLLDTKQIENVTYGPKSRGAFRLYIPGMSTVM
jgi:RecA-family ATPase